MLNKTVLAAGILGAVTHLADASQLNTNWEFLGNGSEMQHHSDLQNINQSTVKGLGLAWSVEMPSNAGLVGNPLVKNGIVYQGGPGGQIYANDLKTGKLLWHFKSEYPPEEAMKQSLLGLWGRQFNRGVALEGDNAIIATGDCRLVAVDQKTGEKRWEVKSCNPTEFYGISAAPRVGAGMVFTGNTCADSGMTRGYVDAFDAKSGEHKWRFYTVPDDPKTEKDPFYRDLAKTWGTDWYSKSHGCGSVWDAMVYDEKLNQLIIGVGGPSPVVPTLRASDAGDELFTNSVVALDASTGKYKWHHKQVPHDAWNMEPAVGLMVADVPVNGTSRHVVVSVPKQGFTYLYDAKTGQFLSGTKYATVNVAKGLDKSGRSIPNPDAQYWKRDGQDTLVIPGPTGAHGWEALALNPATSTVFIPMITMPTTYKLDPASVVAGVQVDYMYGDKPESPIRASSQVVAVDLASNTVKWSSEKSAFPLNGGLLHTAGGLVFQGTADGKLVILDDRTGKTLWANQVGGAIRAAPSTVMLDGEQYVLVATGNGAGASSGQVLGRYTSTPESRTPARLLAFKLGGKENYPALAKPEPVPVPRYERMSAELAAKGFGLFEANGCDICHGREGGASNGGNPPNLNRRHPVNLDVFKAIVQQGALKPIGMPQFETMTDEEAEAIYAYIINSAWAAHEGKTGELEKPVEPEKPKETKASQGGVKFM
ncbi:PQQ-binding-like beta-propeller repeat protein [Pseudomonas sp. BN411]|uniref:outer membrane protein assembly factor BamB family protein n=1 Tax=Pseudomonas sp. BN411 TaxID=2567887 RepID=UPI0024547504|nr:PQQ-binding-like beta-propeller repeat protein [Pseudomonas sp. BN411]MDH4560498.1 hypothetical protein [Pseudomonas sp. BN411]